MQPYYRILADSKDITAALQTRLLSLSITSASGGESDTLEIALDDRGGSIPIPRTGTQMEVSLGYKETGLDRMGLFVVDEIVLSGMPATMTVRARATDLIQSFKAPTGKSWDGVTIGSICSAIAQKHGYKARVAESLASIPIVHIDQGTESDLHFLTRLAKNYGAMSTIAGGELLFVPVGAAQSASGKQLPASRLPLSKISRYEVTYAERGLYPAVQARWTDKQQAKEIPVTVGSGEPIFVIGDSFADAAAAQAAAKSKLDEYARGVSTLSLTCIGDTSLMAESHVNLSGVRTGVNGEWLIKQVSHRFDGQGYRCEVEAEAPQV